MQLAAGSRVKHTPTADMDQKRAKETKEKGGVHTNPKGEQGNGEEKKGKEKV